MDEEQRTPADEHRSKSMSRRQFLIRSGYTLGGAVVGGVLGYLLPKEPPAGATQTPAAPDQASFTDAMMFFTQEQFSITEAAVERIFPEDENGPGAKALGVAYFIDHQLASEWGFNARDYMQGPFFAGEKVQGYQGRLKRRDIFQIGLREIQNYSQTQYGKSFVNLTPEEQDAVLTAFQNDDVSLTTISASGFFSMLRSSTLEGIYSDPLYGGNRQMGGWIMRSYPGSQMSYTQIMDQPFAEIPPRSLRDHVAHS